MRVFLERMSTDFECSLRGCQQTESVTWSTENIVIRESGVRSVWETLIWWCTDLWSVHRGTERTSMHLSHTACMSSEKMRKDREYLCGERAREREIMDILFFGTITTILVCWSILLYSVFGKMALCLLQGIARPFGAPLDARGSPCSFPIRVSWRSDQFTPLFESVDWHNYFEVVYWLLSIDESRWEHNKNLRKK